MKFKTQNFVLFQLLWPACVFGATYRVIWPAVLIITTMLVLGLNPKNRKPSDVSLLVICSVLGFFLDSALATTGSINYYFDLGVQGWAPFWIVFLWAGFALTMNHSMRWVFEKPRWGFPFFAVGGPLSYFAAARVGAVSIDNVPSTLLLGSALWSLIYAVVWLFLSNRLYTVNYDYDS